MPFNFFPFRKKSKSEQNLKQDDKTKHNNHEDDKNSEKKKGIFGRHKSSSHFGEDKHEHSDEKPSEESNGHTEHTDEHKQEHSSKEEDKSDTPSETPTPIHRQPSEPTGENVSEDVKNAGTSSASGVATESNNNNDKEPEVLKKEDTPVQSHKRRPREMKFQATRVEELPKDLKKIARSSRIPDEILDKDFEILLNILHFVTKKVFVTHTTEKERSAAKELQKITDKKTTMSDPPPKSSGIESPKPGAKQPKETKETKERTSLPPNTEQSTTAQPTTQQAQPTQQDNHDNNNNTSNNESQKTEPEVKDSKTEAKPAETKPGEAKAIEKAVSRQSRNLSASLQWDPHSFVVTNKNPKDLFKSLKKSGKGGFGTVFAAKRITDGKKVAIKRMGHATAKEKMDNYSEARYTKMCDHANIVKILEAYEWKEEFWLVLEFLEGGTLTEARRGHDFEEKEIAYVARELLKGLAYLHSINLVHRDVKSENIMMSIMGDIKLIDFGLCSDVSLIRPSMVGSPYWMPPEMLQRNPHSFPCDIWSFGISILELANKNPPNAQNKIKVMFTTATQGCPHPFDEPERWSDKFKDFTSRCLVKDPAKRATAQELLKHPFLEQAADTRKVMQKILSEIFLQKAIGLM